MTMPQMQQVVGSEQMTVPSRCNNGTIFYSASANFGLCCTSDGTTCCGNQQESKEEADIQQEEREDLLLSSSAGQHLIH